MISSVIFGLEEDAHARKRFAVHVHYYREIPPPFPLRERLRVCLREYRATLEALLTFAYPDKTVHVHHDGVLAGCQYFALWSLLFTP
ncbi:MAG TPA: hypothetical protein VEI52_03090 [Terriglobales bacterium]|nr:hypothetical protein [Terriglobales bacterium]